MRRILISTTALSVALTQIATAPLYAQTLTEDGSVIGEDGSVLCLGTVDAPCDLNAVLEELAAQKAAEEAAAAEAAAQAEAEAQAAAEAEAAAQAEAEAAAAAEAEAAAQAEAEAEAQRAAEEAAAAEAAAQAEAEAAAQAEAEAQAAAEAEAAAQAQAEAEAQKAAEEAAAAEAAAQAEAEAQRAAEEAAAAEAAAQEEAAQQEAAPVEEVAPAEEAAPAEEPSLDDAMEQILTEEPAEEPVAEPTSEPETATEEPATDEAITAPEAVDPEAQPEAVAEEPVAEEPAQEAAPETATEEPAAEPEAVEEQPADAAAEEGVAVEGEATAAETAVAEEPVVGADGQPLQTFVAEQPADLIDPAATEVPNEEAIQTLSALLGEPEAATEAETEVPQIEAAVAATTAPVEATEGQPVEIAPSDEAEDVIVQEITADSARSSSQDFSAPASANLAVATSSRDDGLTDLQKFGLVALGALAVGAIINANRDQVVSNTGDRVVVRRGDGDYYVYKDDDALLRQPGSTVRTETFRDGSTRTIVERGDGSQVVTIRDATGRVLRRATYDPMGREIVYIDDLQPEQRIDVSTLPQPRARVISMSTSEEDALLKARMAALDTQELGRTFSLRQIREIREVRQQAATVDVNNITFDTGSAAIKAEQAESLAALGRFMQAMIRENPNEVFLIEGHTDAVGPAALNLTLSDRRAESVALALTEYFDVPPENLVVQGYGESELRVPTQGAERQNRRVAVRIITPLLRSAELR